MELPCFLAYLIEETRKVLSPATGKFYRQRFESKLALMEVAVVLCALLPCSCLGCSSDNAVTLEGVLMLSQHQDLPSWHLQEERAHPAQVPQSRYRVGIANRHLDWSNSFGVPTAQQDQHYGTAHGVCGRDHRGAVSHIYYRVKMLLNALDEDKQKVARKTTENEGMVAKQH